MIISQQVQICYLGYTEKEVAKAAKKAEKEAEMRKDLPDEDKIASLHKKVLEFQSKEKRAPTADELNEMYPEVYV